MSRWTNQLDVIKSSWNDLKAESKKLPNQAEQDASDETSRLHKAIAYIGELLQNVDAELIPYDSVARTSICINECLTCIKDYMNSPETERLKVANTNIDNALSYMSPYVFIEHKAKAASSSFMADIGVATEQVKKLHGEAQDSVADIRKFKKKSNTASEKTQEAEASAQNSADGAGNSASEIENLRAQAEQKRNEIEKYHKSLTEGEGSIVSQIDSAKVEITDELVAVKQKTTELHNFHGDVFGREEKEGEGKKGGLKQEVEKQNANLETTRKNAEKTYSELKERIEGLLPDAASAGLAEAYHDLKKKAESEAIKHTRVFYASLCMLLILPTAVPFLLEKYVSKGGDSSEIITITNMLNTGMFGDLFNKILLLSPILWLAIFSAKRRSEARRLQEEYAHKEALAKSYTGYKTEAEKLEEGGDKTLMRQLLEAAIKAISFNASTTLDKKHGDKTPIHEVAAGAADKLTLKGKKE